MMEMSPKQSTLVLLTVAVLVVSGQENVSLDYIQKKVDVVSGSSLTLHCNLETKKYTRFRVRWFFLPSGSLPNNSQNISGKMIRTTDTPSNRTEQPDSRNQMTHFIPSFEDKDSGWYHCEVIAEIPVFEIIQSNKAQVISIKKNLMETPASLVTRKQATPGPVPENLLIDWWMWIILGVSILILIFLMALFVALRRRYCRGREDPVYANTRPAAKQPSPRPGVSANNNMNTLKTVPSSGNLRPPTPSRRAHNEGKQRYRI